MKTIKSTTCFLFIALFFNTVTAQWEKGEWFAGFGLNIVEDGGAGPVSHSTHFSNPFVFSTAYALSNQFTLDGSLSFNKYKAGKQVDNRIIHEDSEAPYLAFDVAVKFNFRELLNYYVVEPYVFAGPGYTNIGSYSASSSIDESIDVPSIGRLTLNAGIGLNAWFSDYWGINANLAGKIGINSGDYPLYITNQFQFSFGVIYNFKKVHSWR